MNWDQAKGSWTELKGKVKEQWGDLTDDEIDRMAGERISASPGRTRSVR